MHSVIVRGEYFRMSVPVTSQQANTRSGRVTNLLAGCWGFLASYLLIHSLLVTHEIRHCIVAPIPLLIVWATLERKRWGRIALLGVSLMALTLLVTSIGLEAYFRNELPPLEQDAAHTAMMALRVYAQDAVTTTAVVFLALATGIWLCRDKVVAEFERGKRGALAAGQWVIAMTLVTFWAATVVFAAPAATPLPFKNVNGIGSRSDYSHSVQNRASRSDASINRR